MTRTRAFAVGFVLMVVACASVAPKKAPQVDPEEAAHRHAVVLEFTDNTLCSGTVVGPHTILTVKHCVDRYPWVAMVNGTPANIERTHMDGGDQARIDVDLTFDTWAVIGAPAKQGDRVFLYGNPLGLRDLLRRGYIAGNAGPFLAVDLISGGGDSGAGVFNERGEVIGVWHGRVIAFDIGAVQPVIPWSAEGS